jgi:hypothetical protein
MKISISTLLFFLSLAVIPRLAESNFISIETGTVIHISDDHAQIIVTTTNKGDEPAYNLKMSIEIGNIAFSGHVKNSLAPKEQYREEFNTALGFKKAGRYPVIVNTEYTDANLYPFTAPSATYLNYKEALNARVAGIIPETRLAKSGSISLTVNNMDVVERKFHFHLIAPKEILIRNPQGDITVDSGMRKTISFDIKNISALPGSSYPVFVLLSYEDSKYYYSTINTGTITIAKERSLLETYKWPLMAALIILVVIVFIYNSKKFRERDAKA